MNLFNKKILQSRIANYSFPKEKEAERISTAIDLWQKSLKDRDLSKTKEKEVQGKFLNVFFEQILGYVDRTSSKEEEWTLMAEPKTEVDAQTADGAIGFFTKEKEKNTTVGVIELKDAKTSLDKKQKGREKGYTPVEQAYLYATKFDRCKWIIVSNFREIRLYRVGRSEQFVEKFDVLELHKEDEFKKFYFLLNKENLIAKEGDSPIDDLAKKSLDQEEDISKKFYNDYKNIRGKLYRHLSEQNGEVDPKSLFEKSQKILDRIVFILFCEDTANLLPKNILKDTYSLGKKSRDRSDEKIWREMRNLFMDIDEGRNDIDPKINGYNGGLFKFDEILDNLSIKDPIWDDVIALSEYDFETDLNVNILGHIFEQSISDIEAIKSEIEGEEENKTKSKRKKDGIFFTPEYITKYIVENTVGKYLEENPDKLEDIKILDPACGSGAFLNQAHSYLLNEYKVRHEQKLLEKRKKGEELSLFDYNPAEANRAILLNNLFGVDLNDESVEITKLSLWLKTARKDEPLQNLDGNIKTGNSLIDDPEIAGDKAFDWKEEYEDIMKEGGFDVIIANPPYVPITQIPQKERSYYQEVFESSNGRFNLFYFFLEKAKSQVQKGGYVGMIIPDRLLLNTQTKGLREFLLNEFTVLEIITIDNMVFEDAVVNSIILILKNEQGSDSLFARHISNEIELVGEEKAKEIPYSYFESSPSKQFDLNYNPEVASLLEKIKDNSLRLEEVGDIKDGIIQGKVEDLLFLREMKDQDSKKLLFGKDVSSFDLVFSDNWVNYKPDEMMEHEVKRRGEGVRHGLWLRNPEIFERKKILTRQTADRIIGAIDTDNYYYANTLHGTHITDDRYSYEFILGVLNSELMHWYYKTITSEGGKVFAQVKISILKQMPIPKPEIIKEEQVSEKVIQLNNKTPLLREVTRRSIKFLKSEVPNLKVNASLFDEGWNQLAELIESANNQISVKKKEELYEWFEAKKEELTTLKKEIDLLKESIDSELYRLYGLDKNDVAIINKGLSAMM